MCRPAKSIMKGVLQIVSTIILLFAGSAYAQTGKPVIIGTDSTTLTKNPAFTKDTGFIIKNGDTIAVVPKHNPGTATLRSLILPGWGQAYNREYWKIPIVYGGLGTLAGFYIYNNSWYKRAKFAYDVRVNGNDSAAAASIHPRLQPLEASSLQIYRNAFRRDRDYSVLYFLLFWGLNVADATVFGHLKNFDVSEDLSLKINPVIRQNGNAGFSLVLGFRPPANHRAVVLP